MLSLSISHVYGPHYKVNHRISIYGVFARSDPFHLPFSFSISPTKPDIRIPATIWQLVALNMASLGFYFPHNVATWAHFFQKSPFVTFAPSLFCLARLQNFKKKLKNNALGTVMLNNPAGNCLTILQIFLLFFFKFQTANSLRPFA